MTSSPAPPDRAPPPADRRVDTRFPTAAPVQVMTADGVPISGEATNISASGFRMRSPIRVVRGTRLWVRIHGGIKRRAVAMWSDGADTGCRFVRPLGPDTLARFIEG